MESFFIIANNYVEQMANNSFVSKEAVKHMRANLSKNILNSYYNIGNLNLEQMNLLETKVTQVKFSMDSLIKNIINHPELSIDDYKKITDIIANPDETKLSKNKWCSILLLKKFNKTYQVVIKTTQNKEEVFLTSFRFAEH